LDLVRFFETGMFVSIHETNRKVFFLFHETI
jgi:hypothetical protein